MLTLVTTNPAKYEPFARDLEEMRIELAAPGATVPELQSLSFAEALSHKARALAQQFGRPVLVDDAGLVLEAYDPFPGPLTSVVLQHVGRKGLERMLTGVTNRARMECHLGWWGGDGLRSWSGSVQGRVEPARKVSNKRMLLSDLFVPDEAEPAAPLAHRRRALAELRLSAFELHLESAGQVGTGEFDCPVQPSNQCPFCIELEDGNPTIFSEMVGDRLLSRVLYQDNDFVVMPPVGQFIEGGLLLLSRQHFPSFAWLPLEKFVRLEALLSIIRRELQVLWGTAPIVFEHGPAADRTKGVCCVDHAHFNIFPARADIHPHLEYRMNMELDSVAQLTRLRSAEFGYLLVQENDGCMRAYDGHLVPTQLIRRIITQQLGLAERWHWKDYPGVDELVATYAALDGRIRF